MSIGKQEIVQGLRGLGVQSGMVLMVHSSLSAFGRVEGGADTVIEALQEALGPEGTLMMPAMGSAPVFDVATTPSHVGTITDVFWRRPEVKRSIHPTHSAAGCGPLVDRILAGHIDQPTAIGPESPWGRVAQLDQGYLLFLGVDHDRNTLLHTAEDLVDGAYLSTIERDYYDEQHERRTKVLHRFPGPHRDFIGLDRLFTEAGLVRIGKIGGAVCRLMKAGEVLRLAVAALHRDPAAVLCDNPHCQDCVRQRAALKRHRLQSEAFTLSAVLDGDLAEEELDNPLWNIAAEGIKTVEIGAALGSSLQKTGSDAVKHFARRLAGGGFEVRVWPCLMPWDKATVEDLSTVLEIALYHAKALGARYVKLSPWQVHEEVTADLIARAVPLLQGLTEQAAGHGRQLLIENHPQALWRSRDSCAALLSGVNHSALRLAFNPAHFAHLGQHPFLNVWTRGKLKRHTAQLMVSDGCGRAGWPTHTAPGQGQGEVKELLSIMRCRSFDGLLTLTTGAFGEVDWAAEARGFWRLLDSL